MNSRDRVYSVSDCKNVSVRWSVRATKWTIYVRMSVRVMSGNVCVCV